MKRKQQGFLVTEAFIFMALLVFNVVVANHTDWRTGEFPVSPEQSAQSQDAILK